MPLSWFRLDLEGGDGEIPLPDQVHAVIASLIELDGQHKSLRKPYTVGIFDSASSGLSVEVTTLTSAAADNLIQRLATQPRLRLGRQHFELSRLGLVGEVEWTDLLDASGDALRIEVSFLTPTMFRAGSEHSLLPTPRHVFGHLRAVWSHWAPADLRPLIDLAPLEILVSRLEGTTAAWPARRQEWHGFIGDVEYNLVRVPSRERRVLHALALAAPFLGIGAYTTVGMGVARVS